MFSRAHSVQLGKGGGVTLNAPSGQFLPSPLNNIPPSTTPPPSEQNTSPTSIHTGNYGQWAAGTHPAGMHSCFSGIFNRKFTGIFPIALIDASFCGLNFWKSRGKSHKILEKFSDKYYLIFLVTFKINSVLFAKIDQIFSLKDKTLKKYSKNGKKYWSGNFVSPEKWEQCMFEVWGMVIFSQASVVTRRVVQEMWV